MEIRTINWCPDVPTPGAGGGLDHKEFQKILGDYLFSNAELRDRVRLVPAQLSFDPSAENLLDLKRATGKDYLINVQSIIIKSETNSFPTAPAVGSTI